MRPTTDIADLPYGFAVNRLLMPDKFLSELKERGVNLDHQRLEALHQTRLLVPFLRFRRDTSEIARAYREDPRGAWSVARWHPTSWRDIHQAREDGRLSDPAAERFMSRASRLRKLGDFHYEQSVYFYSIHQTVHLSLIKDALPTLKLRRRDERVVGALEVNRRARDLWIERSSRLRETVSAIVALEPIYYPQVMGVLRLEWPHDATEYFKWREKLPLGRMLRWLSVNARWLQDAAGDLLASASLRDPLGPWAEIVAQGNPEKWSKLKGPARESNDLRIAAEILLRYYDELAEAGRAKPLPESSFFRGRFDLRLKRGRPLDAVLTDFGLSPYPRLVLVVEGATERHTFPRVLELFGIRTEDDFISIQDAEGVRRDLAPLVAYLAPKLGEEREDRYVELLRPPTRILVILDAEGPVVTVTQREERRQRWLDRISRTLPREWQQDAERMRVIRDQLDHLIKVETWRKSGDSFEFAHFTDRQIATAIDNLDQRDRKPPKKQLIELVALIRKTRGNLDTLLHGISKVDLADELWPVLERRISQAQRSGKATNVPIVRVLATALNLANELPRGKIVLALRE